MQCSRHARQDQRAGRRIEQERRLVSERLTRGVGRKRAEPRRKPPLRQAVESDRRVDRGPLLGIGNNGRGNLDHRLGGTGGL